MAQWLGLQAFSTGRYGLDPGSRNWDPTYLVTQAKKKRPKILEAKVWKVLGALERPGWWHPLEWKERERAPSLSEHLRRCLSRSRESYKGLCSSVEESLPCVKKKKRRNVTCKIWFSSQFLTMEKWPKVGICWNSENILKTMPINIVFHFSWNEMRFYNFQKKREVVLSYLLSLDSLP